jgi:hypothetical protein
LLDEIDDWPSPTACAQGTVNDSKPRSNRLQEHLARLAQQNVHQQLSELTHLVFHLQDFVSGKLQYAMKQLPREAQNHHDVQVMDEDSNYIDTPVFPETTSNEACSTPDETTETESFCRVVHAFSRKSIKDWSELDDSVNQEAKKWLEHDDIDRILVGLDGNGQLSNSICSNMSFLVLEKNPHEASTNTAKRMLGKVFARGGESNSDLPPPEGSAHQDTSGGDYQNFGETTIGLSTSQTFSKRSCMNMRVRSDQLMGEYPVAATQGIEGVNRDCLLNALHPSATICQEVKKRSEEEGVRRVVVCFGGDGQPSKNVPSDTSIFVVEIIEGLLNGPDAKHRSSTTRENGGGSNNGTSHRAESENDDNSASSAEGDHHCFGAISDGLSSSQNLSSHQASRLSVSMAEPGDPGYRLNAPLRDGDEDTEHMPSIVDVSHAQNRLKSVPGLPHIDYGDIESNRGGPPLEEDVSNIDAQAVERLISSSDRVRNYESQQLEQQGYPSDHAEIRASRPLTTPPPEEAPSRLANSEMDMTNVSFEVNLLNYTKHSSALTRFTILCALCAVAIAVVSITGARRNTSAVAPSSSLQITGDQNTLDFIRNRGSLVCGVVENSGFSIFNDTTGEWTGFEIDLVRLKSVMKTVTVYFSTPN